MKPNNLSSKEIGSLLQYLCALLVIGTAIYVRIRLSGTPLERDEGEYAYMGQLILKGIAPYTSAYTMKLPGAALAYALIMFIFGESDTGIRIGFLFVNISCFLLVYLLGRRFFDKDTALMAAAFYALLSVSESVFGIFAHATHLVVLFSLAGLLLLHHALTPPKARTIFTAGILLGLALLMKQHAALLIVFCLVCLMWPRKNQDYRLLLKDGVIFAAGAVMPYLLVALWMLNLGAFDTFWFWTFEYAREYVASYNGLTELSRQANALARANLPVWLLALAGGCLFCCGTKPRADKFFLSCYLVVAAMMVSAGFYFRAHYFVLLLPPIALLAAFATTSASCLTSQKRIQHLIPPALFAAAIVFSLVAERNYLFYQSPPEVSRTIYGTNPFPEAVQIATYLRAQTTEKDSIAILGSEPEILFYAKRHSATGHIYMYGLMEAHPYAEQMQRQLINEIESVEPAFIVVVNVPTSWQLQPFSLNKILDWGDSYIPLRYDEVAIMEIYGDRPSLFVGQDPVAGYEPKAGQFVSLYKKRW